MQLWVAVRSQDGSEHEMAVDLPPDTTVQALTGALAAAIGVPNPSDHCLTLADGHVATAEQSAGRALRHGDVCTLGARSPGSTPAEPQSQTAGTSLELVVAAGPQAGARLTVPPGTSTVGRDRDAAIRIRDDEVSRRHFEVIVGNDDDLAVRDLGSSNGTYVNGKLIGDAHQPVGPNDVIEVGRSTVRFAP
ncbi:MAG: FHA domain-containing protein, partial [Acidimicrobiales bacterium]